MTAVMTTQQKSIMRERSERVEGIFLKKTKLIMFDYDGVLIDSTHLPLQYYTLLAEKIGTRRFSTWDECREILEANVLLSLKKLGVTTPEKLKIALDLYNKSDHLWKNLKLFPKIKEVLGELKQRGYMLAIVSNNNEETIRHDLEQNNAVHYFDCIIDKKFGYKPETDQIVHCLKVTNTLPEEAVLIDDMDGGIIAAKNAKLKKAIAVSYGFHPMKRLQMADTIIHSPEEILQVIE